jgi:hypothetical protein
VPASIPLPSEVRAEEVVEPPVVRLEVFFQSALDSQIHLLVASLLAPLPSVGFTVGQVEEGKDGLQEFGRALEEVLAL